MILLATPDFGAGAMAAGIICLAWIVVLVLALIGLWWGWKFLGSASPARKRVGMILIGVSLLVPLSCWAGPLLHFRAVHGSFPLKFSPSGKINKGMTKAQVTAILGEPHHRWGENDEETWAYYMDVYGIADFFVRFNAAGKVTGTFFH